MLREETFTKCATEFGTPVGIAHMIKIVESDVKRVKRKVESDDVINDIILDCIQRGEYQNLQRELYKLRRVVGRFKESTIYKKAYKEINGNS